MKLLLGRVLEDVVPRSDRHGLFLVHKRRHLKFLSLPLGLRQIYISAERDKVLRPATLLIDLADSVFRFKIPQHVHLPSHGG